MFSAVAMKSRTFSSFSHSADEKIYRSWDGAQPDNYHKLANGNILYHGCHAQFPNGGWPEGRELFFFFVSVGSNYFLSKSSNFLRNSMKLIFWGSVITAGGLATNWSLSS